MPFLQDLHFSWRNLSRTPGFLIVAVASLALGIGANTALFSLLYSALYRTLPIDDPQLLVLFSNPSMLGMTVGMSTGERDLLTWSEFQELSRIQAIEGMFAAEAKLPKLHVRIGVTQEDARAKMVSGAYFSVLALHPQIGRFFDAKVDEQSGAANFVVLSDDYWARRFGRDPATLGKSIVIQKTSFEIIGVGPRGFAGETVGQDPAFWIPLSMQKQVIPGLDLLHPLPDPAMKVMWLQVFGRLRPGANIAAAQMQADTIFKADLEQSYRGLPPEQRRALMQQSLKLRPAATGASGLRTKFADSLYVVFGAVGAILLICCANLSNLLLTRANARQREITVRLALGANRFRVARQLVTEGLLLSFLGAVAGLLLAQAITPLLMAMASTSESQIHLDTSIDWRILLFTAIVVVLTTLLCSVVPAVKASQTQLISTLREAGRGLTQSRSKLLAGRIFVGAQVALSLILLIGSGLFLRTLANLQNVELGYQRHGLALVNVGANATGLDEANLKILFQRIQQRLQAEPGVTSATYSANGLFSGSEMNDTVQVEGYLATGKEDKVSLFDAVGPGYFSALNIKMLKGREIDTGDVPGGHLVCDINQAFAKQFFAGRNPIGKHITFDSKAVYEVVGMASDSRDHTMRDAVKPRVFLSFAQSPLDGTRRSFTYEVRLAAEGGAVLNSLRRAVQSVNPDLDVEVRVLSHLIDNDLNQERLVARVVTLFGGLALALAAVGIYGILAYGVSQRTSEIGVRMAVGASIGNVVNMIARETFFMISCGVAIGILGSYFLTRLVQSKLFGVGATDPVVIFVSVGLLLLVGLLAATLPAFRATRIDPAIALRDN